MRVPVRTAHALHAAIAGSRLHLFEGTGQLPVFSAPDDSGGVLRGFLNDAVG
jgi:hypothetical protein